MRKEIEKAEIIANTIHSWLYQNQEELEVSGVSIAEQIEQEEPQQNSITITKFHLYA